MTIVYDPFRFVSSFKKFYLETTSLLWVYESMMGICGKICVYYGYLRENMCNLFAQSANAVHVVN